MGQAGLLAALLLLAVPTMGRLLHAGPAHGPVAAADGARHHAHGPAHAPARAAEGAGGDTRPAPGDAECDYCPLLTALAAMAAPAWRPVAAPGASMPRPALAAPRRAWLHPNGLGSRGPPHAG